MITARNKATHTSFTNKDGGAVEVTGVPVIAFAGVGGDRLKHDQRVSDDSTTIELIVDITLLGGTTPEELNLRSLKRPQECAHNFKVSGSIHEHPVQPNRGGRNANCIQQRTHGNACMALRYAEHLQEHPHTHPHTQPFRYTDVREHTHTDTNYSCLHTQALLGDATNTVADYMGAEHWVEAVTHFAPCMLPPEGNGATGKGQAASGGGCTERIERDGGHHG